MSTTEIFLKNGRFYRRESFDYDLGNQDVLLAGMAEFPPMMLRRLWTLNDRGVHLLIHKNRVTVVGRIESIPFTSWFQLNNDRKLEPTFQYPNQGAIKMSHTWTPPKDVGELYFAVTFQNPKDVTLPIAERAYLFLYRNGKLWWFPYPNLYNDGRICMGPEWDRKNSTGQGLFADYAHAYRSFMESQVTDHLTTDNTRIMFAREIDGGWTHNNADFIVPNLREVSNAFMMGFEP